MNQILITQKLYVTPEVKRKSKFYKFYFLMSIFCLCMLCSLYIYAEYDRNKSEEVGKRLLGTVVIEKPLNAEEDRIWSFVLGEEASLEEVEIPQEQLQEQLKKEVLYSQGEPYWAIATINIPKINVEYAVLSRTSDELLKMSPTRFRGPEPNEAGNLCIVGHNYRNTHFFSKVPELEKGDTIDITDGMGRTITYEMYDTYIVDPDNKDCLSQETNGKREVTLITCTNDSLRRIIVKFREKR